MDLYSEHQFLWDRPHVGHNITFEINIDDSIYMPVFHITNIEPSQVRTFSFGNIAASAVSTNWTEVTDTGGTTSLLEPNVETIMYNVRAGVSPSQGVLHMRWPENTFYGDLRGKGSDTDVIGGVRGLDSSTTNPIFQIFNLYNIGHPMFKVYNTGGAAATFAARFEIDKMNVQYIGLNERWDQWVEKNTGVPITYVSLGGLKPMYAPSWLANKIRRGG